MSWKSLTDTYLQEAAGRKVRKLPRQEIIGEVYDVKFKRKRYRIYRFKSWR